MKPDIINHYQQTCKRGLITPITSIDDFMQNMDVQYSELLNAYADDIDLYQTPSDSLVKELVGLLLTITNTCQHFGVDLSEEIGKHNQY